MKFQGAAVIVLCGLCGLVASQVSTDHVIPWWPKNQVTEVSGSQESTDKGKFLVFSHLFDSGQESFF